jgi:hypothetical protein
MRTLEVTLVAILQQAADCRQVHIALTLDQRP